MKKPSSFLFLNATQCFVTLNDSIFRLVVTYSLIDLLGEQHSNTILALSAALFILPFLLFTYPSGQLADRYSKKSVIMWSLWAELVFMFLGFFAIMMKNQAASYFALFLIALQSSVFNPAKYAILPEVVSKDRLSNVNGIMVLSMYLSIILGTFLATIICEVTNRNYLFVIGICIVFSILAIFTGYGIEKTPIKNAKRKIKVFYFLDIFRMLGVAKKQPHLVLAIFATAYFLFTAAYTQLNLIPFGMQSLGITDVQTGYIYLAAALGVGFGSMMVALLSGKTVELGLSLWGAFGTGISYVILYFVQYNLPVSCLMFFFVGMHGGLYVVPLDAYIQFASPDKHRGSIVGVSSLLSFIAVLFSSAAIAIMGNVLDMRAATGYLVIGIMTLSVSTWVLLCLPEYVTRLFAVLAVKFFFGLKAEPAPEKSLIIAKKRSVTSLFCLVYSYQKIRFLRCKKKPPSRLRIGVGVIFNQIPVYLDNEGNFSKSSKIEIKKCVKEGYTLCVFEDDRNMKEKKHFKEAVAALADKQPVRAQIERVADRPPSFFHFFQYFHPIVTLKFRK